MIHSKIPLTRGMGLRVIKSSAQKVVFSLPHSPNINHVGTVFGGSIAAAQAVCCWSLLLNYFEESGLKELKPHVVLREGTNNYSAPLKGTFEVECKAPSASVLSRFKKDLVQKKRAKLKLKASAHPKASREKAHVEFLGDYFVYVK